MNLNLAPSLAGKADNGWRMRLPFVQLLWIALAFQTMSGFCGGVVSSASETAFDAALAGGGSVTLAFDGTLMLSSSKAISADTVIDGSGHAVTISGANTVGLFTVDTQARLELVSVTLANGYRSSGGAISNTGAVVASGCLFVSNNAVGPVGNNGQPGGDGENEGGDGTNGQGGEAGRGGAIYSTGSLTFNGCAFSGNSAMGGNGGNGGNGGYGRVEGGSGGDGGSGAVGQGGAVYTSGAMAMTNCLVENNVARGGNGGEGGGRGTMEGGVLSGEEGNGGQGVQGGGGGIMALGPTVYASSTFSGNQCYGGNSGTGGRSGYDGQSGKVGGNGFGGAVHNRAASTTINCTFYGNSARGGKGGNGGPGEVDGGGGGDGGVGSGGGFYNDTNSATILSSTFSSCVVYGGAGGAGGSGSSPGNSGAAGQRLGGNLRRAAGTVTLRNTILASGTPSNANGSITDQGCNISSDTTPATLTGTGSRRSTNPLLSPLANNGGMTWTCAIATNSPAKDKADAQAPNTDQRGLYRTYSPDIGSYEFNGSAVPYMYVNIRAVDAYASEYGNTALFSITRTGKTTEQIAVGLGITGTAVPGSDYTTLPTNIVMAAGLTITNLIVTVTPDALTNESAKTIVVGLKTGTNYALGLYTNAVVTLGGETTLARANNSAGRWYVRGAGLDNGKFSTVVAFDGVNGQWWSGLVSNSPYATCYHIEGASAGSQNYISNRLAFNMPIVLFGRNYGTPLYIQRSYSFGISEGVPTTDPIRIEAYRRSDMVYQGVVTLSQPDAANATDWNQFATNGFARSATGFGLTTTLLGASDLAWGSGLGCWMLTHTATAEATNYVYLVCASGTIGDQPMVRNAAGAAAPNYFYELTFEDRASWRSVFVDQPHFQGQPLPPDLWNKTPEELLAYGAPVSNTVPLSPSACLALDQSPELRRHPVLDQFVTDMNNDPLALANYVQNEIELCDPAGLRDDGQLESESVNLGGVNRGALGVFMEGQGSPMEQCALLIYMLRKAGYPASYVFPPDGGLKMLDTRLSALLRMRINGAVDNQNHYYTTNTLIPVNYPWVAAYVSNQWVHLFPWIKDTQVEEGLNVQDYLPAPYQQIQLWVKDYIMGKSNLMAHVQDGNNTAASVFKNFLKAELARNAPGVSIDDLGIRCANRRHLYTTWTDFPRPTLVATNSIAVESLGSPGITNVSSRLTNVFDTVQVQLYSVMNPQKEIWTPPLRMADLHNRKFFLTHTNEGNGQVRAVLVLAPYSSYATGQGTFAASDSALTNRQEITLLLDGTDDHLGLRLRYRAQRAIPWETALDPLRRFLDIVGPMESLVERPLRKGDLAAICVHAGRVTPAMLRVHAGELWNMEQQLNANPELASQVPLDVYQGSLVYLMGMSYYERVSRDDLFLRDIFKMQAGGDIAMGLAKLSPRRVSGGDLAEGNIDPVWPNVDMFFHERVRFGNGTARLDSGRSATTAMRDYLALSITSGSSQEHAIIESFLGQTGAVSTVKALRLAQAAAAQGGPGVVELTSANYQSAGNTVYNGVALKSHDPSMWAAVSAMFQSADSQYAAGWITPGTITSGGSFSGMGALVLGVGEQAALIGNGLYGAYGQEINSGSISGLNTPQYQLQQDASGNYNFSYDSPVGTQAAPETTPVYDLFSLLADLDAGRYLPTPAQDQIASAVGQVLWSPGGDYADSLSLSLDLGAVATRPCLWDTVFGTVADPVSPLTGELYVDAVDLSLPGPMPLQLRRNYGSQNLANNQLGYGWKLSYMPYLTVVPGTNIVYAAEPDGSVLAFGPVGTDLWAPTLALNPTLNNHSQSGVGSVANKLNARLKLVAGSTNTWYLTNSDGGLRIFQEMSFPLAASPDLDRLRPYLTKWFDNRGNFYSFEYGTTSSQADYGQVRRIVSSSGNILRFEFDVYGRVVEVYSVDGRRVSYEYDRRGDLVGVTLPDCSQVSYSYKIESWEQGLYSTHLLVREEKPDGRVLQNDYDSQRRVTNQWATVGPDLRLVRNATFVYTNSFNLTNLTATLTGTTTILDYTNNPTTYFYTNGLIRRIRDPLGAQIVQEWYEENETNAPAYPRGLKRVTDKRGLQTTYLYDSGGNATNVTVKGDLRGDGDMNATAATITVFNPNSNLPEVTITPSGATNRFFYTNTWLLARSEFWPSNATPAQAITNLYSYVNVTNADGTASYGLRALEIRAAWSADAATNEMACNSRGYPVRLVRHTGTGDPAVIVTNLFNPRGELVVQTDASGRSVRFGFTPLGNPESREFFEAGQTLPLSWEYSYYNENGEVTWSDGPRFDPEDYVWRDYDGAGRRVQEIRWRTQGNIDGQGVEPAVGDGLFAASFNQFDPFGNLVRTIDPLGNYSVKKYDSIGQLLREEFYSASGALLATNGFRYSPAGDVTNAWNALGGLTETRYTSTGKPKFQKNPDGSTNSWLYLADGRLWREYQRNGAYWETTYNDALRKTTRVFHTAAGTALATNSAMMDRRGNVVSTTDAASNTSTNFSDGLDRPKYAAGPLVTNVVLSGISPVTVTNISRQSRTWVYDSSGRTNTVVNALGEKVVTAKDALGRSVGDFIYASNSVTPVRVTTTAYTADHHGYTVTEGTGTNAISATTYTDTYGQPVLNIRYPQPGQIQYTWQQYDRAGNRTLSAEFSSDVLDTWSFAAWTYDGLNRVATETSRDWATTTFSRDAMGNVTNRLMPGGLQWSASFDNAGRMVGERDSASGQTSRNAAYAYYQSGDPWPGLLKTVTDGRGVARTNAYNDWLDVAAVTTTGPLNEHKMAVAWQYDARRLPTNISQSFASGGTGPATSIRRAYTRQGQLLSESVALDGGVVSAASQGWDAAGRRTQVSFGAWSAGFQYRADGRMSAVNDSVFGYADNGQLLGRTNSFRSVTVTSRDGAGRPLQSITRAGVSTPLTETWTWTSDGLPNSYTAQRSDFTDTRGFTYGPLHRRLLQETLNLSASQSITNVYEFDQGQAGGLGVMTLANQSGALPGNWSVAGTNQDAFQRVTGERSTILTRVAKGTVNGPATLSGNINGRPLDLRYNPATGGQWSADMDLVPGQNTLTLYAAHPSGQFTTNKASTFTVDASAADVVDTKFDGGGYVTNRVWKNSQGQVLRTQNLTWDAFGRLVKQTERDVSNNGYNWQTDFDPLGRRLRTVTLPVTNNVAINSQQRTLNHFYDPQVEFLEVGLSVNGTTTWKTYGPDLDGAYGGQQGLGGLETLTTGSETVGVVQDGFGNVLGSAKNGSVTWNAARLGLYGPAEGYPGLSLSAGPLTAEHLAYRGKWRDEAGFYYWGARPYEAERRSFLSFDTMGRDATPDGYAAFSGRPSDLWDPDGRLGKGTYLDLNTLQQFTAYDSYYLGSGAAMAGERVNWSFDTPMTDWPSETLNGQSFRMVFGNEAAGFAEFGMAMGTGPFGIPAEIADAFYQAGTASVGGSGGEQAFAYTRASASMLMAAMAAEVPARGFARNFRAPGGSGSIPRVYDYANWGGEFIDEGIRFTEQPFATKAGTTVFRQGTFADETLGWAGNYVKGLQWASDNPLTTPDYAKKYGLPAENTGNPDWIVGGRIQGPYTTRPAPPSHNNPGNTGGAPEVLPQNPNDVSLDWFHMPD